MKSHSLYALIGMLVMLCETGCDLLNLRDRPVPFHSVVSSPEGFPLPRYPWWSLKGRDMSKADRLPDPNSLYVFHYSREQITGDPKSLAEGYSFMRFWPDGRYIHRSVLMKDLPTSKDGDDFRWSHVGYYTVVGSRIEMELYGAEGGGMYEKRSGTISDLGITENTVEREKLKVVNFYRRLQLPKNSMTRVPTW